MVLELFNDTTKIVTMAPSKRATFVLLAAHSFASPLMSDVSTSNNTLSLLTSRGEEFYTLSNGCPIENPLGTLRYGNQLSGHILLQDINLIDTLTHFTHERIPERHVYPKSKPSTRSRGPTLMGTGSSTQRAPAPTENSKSPTTLQTTPVWPFSIKSARRRRFSLAFPRLPGRRAALITFGILEGLHSSCTLRKVTWTGCFLVRYVHPLLLRPRSSG